MDFKKRERLARFYMYFQALLSSLFCVFLAWMLFFVEMGTTGRILLALLLAFMLYVSWRRWQIARTVPPLMVHPEFFPEQMTPAQGRETMNSALFLAAIGPLVSLAIGWDIYDFEHGLKTRPSLPSPIGVLYEYGGFWTAILAPCFLSVIFVLYYRKQKIEGKEPADSSKDSKRSGFP